MNPGREMGRKGRVATCICCHADPRNEFNRLKSHGVDGEVGRLRF